MSEYRQIRTELRDAECVLKALAELGYGPGKVEVGNDLPLYGYQGDVRPETADIVVRRKDILGQSNDVGFALQADGSYDAVVSEYDLNNGFRWEANKADFMREYTASRSEKALREHPALRGQAVKIVRRVLADGSVSITAEASAEGGWSAGGGGGGWRR